MVKKTQKLGYYVLKDVIPTLDSRIVKINKRQGRKQTWSIAGSDVEQNFFKGRILGVSTWTPLVDGCYTLKYKYDGQKYEIPVSIEDGVIIPDIETSLAWNTPDIFFTGFAEEVENWQAYPVENADEQPPWNE